MGRCCAVHGCVSGRMASKSVRKVALFKVPKDVELRNKWISALGQELKATSFICELHFNPEDVIKSDREILKDGSIYVYEYQKVHLKKKAEPKSNIINDSNDNNNSLLSDNELPNTSDIIDHAIIGDCSFNSVETSTVHEIINEVVKPENINLVNTNFPDGANTAIENDNLLVINKTEEFSFYSIKEIFETQPLRKNWSWTFIKNSFISLSYISSKLELVCHIKIDMDLNVTIMNAKTNIVIDMNVNISSIACIWQLLISLENSFFCSGTGYNDKKCSVTCTGILLPEERYKKKVVEYRCITCRKLRRLIQKRKTETTNNDARWMNFKHRYILQRRKLNRVVHTGSFKHCEFEKA
ncbi:uncharacterized protein LOC130664996 [Microplitis mediator]|uniref:uncharacterized protein LOC130664996 n=1 Tax=Microplitis mediator TaxID=375433 RepID=UPI0025548BE7|nr:uncharacterized protein LOC130664996 [Microplitis mediator]